MPKRKKSPRKSLAAGKAAEVKKPFVAHIAELRRRLFYVAVSVIVWSCAAYGVQHYLVKGLLRPAAGQDFIYTTPGGGIDFLFRICIYTGVLFTIPVIIYQLLKYIEPIMNQDSLRFTGYASVVSGILAAIGVTFGYFIGLPAALHFLLNQFTTSQITAMITIQSYMSFVLVYLLGSALLLQVPLILVSINRIKPLQPKRLLRHERWVILGSFILGGLLSPTPNVMDQLMLAGPMIIMYQVGIVIIWIANRHKKVPKRVAALRQKDAEVQAERLAKLQATWQQAEKTASTRLETAARGVRANVQAEVRAIEHSLDSLTVPALQPEPVTVAVAAQPQTSIPTISRPSKYVDSLMNTARTPRYNSRGYVSR